MIVGGKELLLLSPKDHFSRLWYSHSSFSSVTTLWSHKPRRFCVLPGSTTRPQETGQPCRWDRTRRRVLQQLHGTTRCSVALPYAGHQQPGAGTAAAPSVLLPGCPSSSSQPSTQQSVTARGKPQAHHLLGLQACSAHTPQQKSQVSYSWQDSPQPPTS